MQIYLPIAEISVNIFLLIGLGGVVGIGTVLFVFGIGPCVGIGLTLVEKISKKP